MKEKIDNRDMCSIGKFFPYKTRATFNEEDFRLDHLETQLWKHLSGESIEIVGFWVPTGDYNYVRAILNTEEVPADVVPFMRMQVFLDKLDEGVIHEWVDYYGELRKKEAEERDARAAEWERKQREALAKQQKELAEWRAQQKESNAKV